MSDHSLSNDNTRVVTAITNQSWDTPDNVISLSPLPKIIPSAIETETSGGTLGLLSAFRSENQRVDKSASGLPELTPAESQLNNHPLNTPSFDTDTMMQFLDGGKTKLNRRRFIQNPTKKMDFLPKYSMARPESLNAHLKLFTQIHDKYVTRVVPSRDDVASMTTIAAHTGTMANHYGLGVNTILNAASDDQRDLWLPAGMQTQIIISYAQTELKHGSNVRGLQTTAEYIHDHNCFVINSNTLGGQKWWPGGLGATSTHAIVYANLIIAGIDYGIHAFFVQVRDSNHRPLPGITIGANGDCLGDYGNDTGFLGLKDVVVPKFNMLAKWQHIDENGVYIKSAEKIKNPRLHYLTMMQTRAGMVVKQSGLLARGVTIACRYSYVRTQGFMHPNLATAVNLAQQKNIRGQSHGSGSTEQITKDNLAKLEKIQNGATKTKTSPVTQYQPKNESQVKKSNVNNTIQRLNETDPSHGSGQKDQDNPNAQPCHQHNPHNPRDPDCQEHQNDSNSGTKSLHNAPNTSLVFPTSSSVSLTPDQLLVLIPDPTNSKSDCHSQRLRLPLTSIPHQWRVQPIPLLRPSQSSSPKLFSFQLNDYPIIEYSTQRNRIFKQLSLCYLLKSTGMYMNHLFNEFSGGESMGTNNLDLTLLSDLAPLTAGLKAMTTSMTHQGLSDLRESLGGNGYLKANGIGTLSLDYIWELNAEGDRVPMLLQCGRHILKQFDNVIQMWLKGNETVLSIESDSKTNPSLKSPSTPILSISPSNGYLNSFGDALIGAMQSINSNTAQNSSKSSPKPSLKPSIATLPGLPHLLSIYSFTFGDLVPHLQTDSPRALFDQESPIFLVYLFRLLQFKSLCLWVQVLHHYCVQLQYLSTILNQSQSQAYVQNGKSTSPDPPILPSQLHSPTYTTPHQEIIFNSISQLMLLATEQHCRTFIFACFVSQLLSLHALAPPTQCSSNSTLTQTSSFSGSKNAQIAVKLIQQDGVPNPFQANLAAQIKEETKAAEKNHQKQSSTLPQPVSCPHSPESLAHTSNGGAQICPHQMSLTSSPLHIASQLTYRYSTLLPVLTNLATFWVSNEYLQDTPSSSQPLFTSHQMGNREPSQTPIKPAAPNLLCYSYLTDLHITSSHSLIPEAIALCDAFDISDSVLASVVGGYHGNVYEALYHNALASENNKSSPWSEIGYNSILANRVDTDLLDDGKQEQNELYTAVFGGPRQLNQGHAIGVFGQRQPKL